MIMGSLKICLLTVILCFSFDIYDFAIQIAIQFPGCPGLLDYVFPV